MRGIPCQIVHRDFDPANPDSHNRRFSFTGHGPLVSCTCMQPVNSDAMAVSLASHVVRLPPTADQAGLNGARAPPGQFGQSPPTPSSESATNTPEETVPNSSSRSSSKKWAPKVRTGCLTCRQVQPSMSADLLLILSQCKTNQMRRGETCLPSMCCWPTVMCI